MKSDNNVMRGCYDLCQYIKMFINMTIIYVLEMSMKEMRKGGFGKEGGV